MNYREIWHEHNFKFANVDPTPWIPIEEEEPNKLYKLWKRVITWIYSL